jgi:hypothetical protein
MWLFLRHTQGLNKKRLATVLGQNLRLLKQIVVFQFEIVLSIDQNSLL